MAEVINLYLCSRHFTCVIDRWGPEHDAELLAPLLKSLLIFFKLCAIWWGKKTNIRSETQIFIYLITSNSKWSQIPNVCLCSLVKKLFVQPSYSSSARSVFLLRMIVLGRMVDQLNCHQRHYEFTGFAALHSWVIPVIPRFLGVKHVIMAVHSMNVVCTYNEKEWYCA